MASMMLGGRYTWRLLIQRSITDIMRAGCKSLPHITQRANRDEPNEPMDSAESGMVKRTEDFAL